MNNNKKKRLNTVQMMEMCLNKSAARRLDSGSSRSRNYSVKKTHRLTSDQLTEGASFHHSYTISNASWSCSHSGILSFSVCTCWLIAHGPRTHFALGSTVTGSWIKPPIVNLESPRNSCGGVYAGRRFMRKTKSWKWLPTSQRKQFILSSESVDFK